jgi:hypothetical protein
MPQPQGRRLRELFHLPQLSFSAEGGHAGAVTAMEEIRAMDSVETSRKAAASRGR